MLQENNNEKKYINGMRISTPELLWHGGGNENGKPDPVYSVDILSHSSNSKKNSSTYLSSSVLETTSVLATAGIDANVPPKGSVRLWKINSITPGQEFLVDFCDHQTVVNVARFSPCGTMLASASDRQIVVYTVSHPSVWATLTDVKGAERMWLRPNLDEMYDLNWSPCSQYIVAGAIDSKAEILRISTRDTLLLTGHTSYVQGVSWDPWNTMVVTQSADRSCKFHQLKYKSDTNTMVKLAPRGHNIAKMHGGYIDKDKEKEKKVLTAEDFGMSIDDKTGLTAVNAAKSRNLYADSTVPSFFRRPCFSIDGNLIVTPTGIHRPPINDKQSPDHSFNSFCTHIYTRDQLTTPAVSLVGLEDPSVAIRFSPILYNLINSNGDSTSTCLFKGKYRMIFAVVTVTAVFVYDTQHSFPIVRLGGLHLASINDATWTNDGRMLVICASDGYVSFIRFDDGILGSPLIEEDVPISVKKNYFGIYDYKDLSIKEVIILNNNDATVSNDNLNNIETIATDVDINEVINKEIESIDNRTTLVEVKNVTHFSPKVTGSIINEDSNRSICESTEKKRRRITPTTVEGGYLISNLFTSATSNIEASSPLITPISSNLLSPQVAALLSHTSSQNAVEKKIKKRITPILISSDNISSGSI